MCPQCGSRPCPRCSCGEVTHSPSRVCDDCWDSGDGPTTTYEKLEELGRVVDRLMVAVWADRWDLVHFVGVVWVAALVVVLVLGLWNATAVWSS